MKLLKEIWDSKLTRAADYSVRRSSRAVLVDWEGRVALIHLPKKKLFKLPGWGIEEGETKEEALKRECIEELGVYVKILKEIGMTVEYRHSQKMIQESYCFLVVATEFGESHFTKWELDDGCEVVWMAISEGIEKMRSFRSNIESHQHIAERELAFLLELDVLHNKVK